MCLETIMESLYDIYEFILYDYYEHMVLKLGFFRILALVTIATIIATDITVLYHTEPYKYFI